MGQLVEPPSSASLEEEASDEFRRRPATILAPLPGALSAEDERQSATTAGLCFLCFVGGGPASRCGSAVFPGFVDGEKHKRADFAATFRAPSCDSGRLVLKWKHSPPRLAAVDRCILAWMSLYLFVLATAEFLLVL